MARENAKPWLLSRACACDTFIWCTAIMMRRDLRQSKNENAGGHKMKKITYEKLVEESEYWFYTVLDDGQRQIIVERLYMAKKDIKEDEVEW